MFQWGWLSGLLGTTQSPVTLSYLPTILVAIIFGLSSDCEVFVVSRIKEDFTKTVDAFLVRQTLVPAVMAIIGARLWWHPCWFARYVPDPDIEGDRLEKQLAEEQRMSAPTPSGS